MKSDFQNLTDQELIRLFQAGQTIVFDEIVHRYEEQLIAYAGKMLHTDNDIQEVVQNTMVTAFEHLHKFRSEANLFTWLYKIMHNQTISYYRSKYYKNSLITQTIFAENSICDIKNEAVTYFSNDCPERSFMNKEIKLFINSIIKKLPQTLQTTADLYFNQDLSPKEIAQKLSCPRGTVRSHLHRIRKILIPLMQDFLNENHSRPLNLEEKK